MPTPPHRDPKIAKTKRLSASHLEQRVRDAKADLIRSGRDVSPLNIVRHYPWSSVTAVAASGFAMTVIGRSNVIGQVFGSLLTSVAALGITLARSHGLILVNKAINAWRTPSSTTP